MENNVEDNNEQNDGNNLNDNIPIINNIFSFKNSNFLKSFSKRKKEIFIQDNKYIFEHIRTSTNNVKLFRCSFFKHKKNFDICSAKIYVDNNNKFISKDSRIEHTNHNDKSEQIKGILILQETDKIVNNTKDKYSLTVSKMKAEISSKIDNNGIYWNKYYDQMNKRIKVNLEKEPNNIDQINYDHFYFKTNDNESILVNKTENYILLSTKKLADIAFHNNSDLFIDATFDIAPLSYKQVLIIRTYIEKYNEFLTLFFAYMTDKTQNLYEKVLLDIKNYINANSISNHSFNIINMHCDMENALINGILKIFPNCNIKICMFHMLQAIRRYLCYNGYNDEFNRNLDYKRLIDITKYLYIVPEILVFNVFMILNEKALATENAKVIQYYKYFNKQYFQRIKSEWWNYHNSIKNYTNNNIESYNHVLQNIIKQKNPGFYKTLKIFKDELINSELKYVNIIAQKQVNKRNCLNTKQKEIFNLFEEINKQFLEFRKEYEGDEIDEDNIIDIVYLENNYDNYYEILNEYSFFWAIKLQNFIGLFN